MKKNLFIANILLLFFHTCVYSVWFETEENFKEKSNASRSAVKLIVEVAENKYRTASAKIYRYKGKIIGISAAHTFDHIENPKSVKLLFNESFRNSSEGPNFNYELEINPSIIAINKDYSPPKDIFQERDPDHVKSDILLFTVPELSESVFNETPELKFDEKLQGLYKIRTESCGNVFTNDLKILFEQRGFHRAYGEVIYNPKDQIYKIPDSTNRLALQTNVNTHKISFNALSGSGIKLKHLDGDSGSCVIEDNPEGRSLGLFAHTDYMPFFSRNSPLAKMFNEQVLQKDPSIQRTKDFLESLKTFAEIIAQRKQEEIDIYIVQLKEEQFPYVSLITPLHIHQNFIDEYAEKSKETLICSNHSVGYKLMQRKI